MDKTPQVDPIDLPATGVARLLPVKVRRTIYVLLGAAFPINAILHVLSGDVTVKVMGILGALGFSMAFTHAKGPA